MKRLTSLNIESNHSYWNGTVIFSRYTMILSNKDLYTRWSLTHYPINAPCEVDVADDHDVEMPEQLKLLQAHSSLAIS